MATWISVQGEWKPAKEHVVLPHLQGTDREIYDGPDRAALLQLWEDSGKPTDPKKAKTFLGSSFKTDPEFIGRVRQMGFASVNEYFTAIGFDEKSDKESAEQKAVTVKSHEIAKRAKEIEIYGGGVEQGSGKVIASGAIGDVSMPV